MIPLIIFSKDRACQLHCLLDSLLQNGPKGIRPTVIYKATTSDFEAGYYKLFGDLDGVNAWSEGNDRLIDIFWACLEGFSFKQYPISPELHKINLFGIATDDCVFYRKCNFTAGDIEKEFEDTDLWCFSLRLGLNTLIQDYTTGRTQPPLDYYEENDKFIKWHYKSYNPLNNYGYLSGQDGCLYRISDYVKFKDKNFTDMRNMESEMAKLRDEVKPEWMSAPHHSVLVNIPKNNCQEPYIANGAVNQMSLEELNDKYLDGYTLDWSKINNVVGCHQDIPMEFKQ